MTHVKSVNYTMFARGHRKTAYFSPVALQPFYLLLFFTLKNKRNCHINYKNSSVLRIAKLDLNLKTFKRMSGQKLNTNNLGPDF